MAVRPKNGITQEMPTMKRMAFLGIPAALSSPSRFGRIFDLDMACMRRLIATIDAMMPVIWPAIISVLISATPFRPRRCSAEANTGTLLMPERFGSSLMCSIQDRWSASSVTTGSRARKR